MYNLKQARNLDKIDLEELKMQIKHDNKDAMFALGMMYLNGVRVQQDTEKALAWLNKAVTKMHQDAAYNLSLIYLTAQCGVPCHIKKGRDYLELAVKSGRTDLHAFLRRIDDEYRPLKYQAEAFDESLMFPQKDRHDEREGYWRYLPKQMPDINKIIGIIILAAAFIILFIRMAIIMRTGSGFGDFGRVLKALITFIPMVFIGIYFLMIRKPRERMPDTFKIPVFKESDQNDANSLEQHLSGVNPSSLEEQANGKNSDAMFKLGFMHYKGIRTPQDFTKASLWFKKSAMLRNADAAYLLGIMTIKGEGLPANIKQGFNLLEAAANQNHAEAQTLIKRIEKRYKRSELNNLQDFDFTLLEPDTQLIDPAYKNRKIWMYAAGFVLLYVLPFPYPFGHLILAAYITMGIFIVITNKI